MKTKKMSTQVKAMVECVNDYLAYRHIKDISDHIFSDMCWLLSNANCYHGYNYYTLEGTLSGGDNEEFDHLQIYIA